MRELIARRIAGGAIALLILASSLVATGRAQNKVGTSLDPQNFGQIERGRYLAIAGDCASCHTVPGSDQPFAGGRPIETPFGVVVGANITPDPETGIGAWSDELFVRALREGKGQDGQLLYPAMPYPYYTKLTESDALAIRAYLNTVKPVRNAVVSNRLPFPFDVRRGNGGLERALFQDRRIQAGLRRNPRNGIAAPTLLKAWAIAGPVTRPKRSLAATIARTLFRAMRCKDGSRPTSPTTTSAALAGGRVADIVAYLKNGHNLTTALDRNHGRGNHAVELAFDRRRPHRHGHLP